MRSLTRTTLVLGLIYVLIVGGFALWQYEETAAAGQAVRKDPARAVDLYDAALHSLGAGALNTLTLVGGLGLALYVLLVRRSREVRDLLEGALAGRTLPAPQVKDDFAPAFAAAERVGHELNLERERGAQARQRLTTLSALMDVGVLLVNPSRHLDFANSRACELLGCADPAELERRWPEIARRRDQRRQRARAGQRVPPAPAGARPRRLTAVLHAGRVDGTAAARVSGVCKGDAMSSPETHGKVKNLTGRVKEAAGIITGDSKLEQKGSQQRAAGAVQENIGKARRKVGQAVKDLGAAIKR